MNTTNAHAHCGLKPGHYKIMSYEGLRNYRHLLAWNARESLDTNKSDAVMRSRRFFPSRERSSVLLLAIMINSQPQKNRQNRGEKTPQTFHENGQRFAKVTRDWGTGRSVPSPPAPLGCFCHLECTCLACPETKIENWFQFSIFNF